LDYFKRFNHIIKSGIKRAEKKIRGNGARSDPDPTEERVYDQIQWERQKEVEKVLEALGQTIKSVKMSYYNDYQKIVDRKQRARKKPYPFLWMTDLMEKHNNEAFTRYQYINPMLNFLYNHNRHYSAGEHKEWFDRMVELADSVTGGERYQKRIYSSFVADDKFFAKAAKALGCKKSTIKKYLRVFHAARIIEKLGVVSDGKKGRNPILYADGYFTDYKKMMFLKNTPEYKKALLSLAERF